MVPPSRNGVTVPHVIQHVVKIFCTLESSHSILRQTMSVCSSRRDALPRRRSRAQSQAEVEALERRLAEAQDAEGRALADLRDAEQALADRWLSAPREPPGPGRGISCARCSMQRLVSGRASREGSRSGLESYSQSRLRLM